MGLAGSNAGIMNDVLTSFGGTRNWFSRSRQMALVYLLAGMDTVSTSGNMS